ncbi:MAG: hypothetical protein DRQ46_00445 [Gammaproteobacteria bacterium]|nr:MAG: hypothetical protein DRQ46_00445 [Gammaproteobacteria bacterium]
MDFKAILAKHGIENEAVIADLQTAIDTSNMIPKSRFNEVISQRNDLQATNTELENNLAKATANLGDIKVKLTSAKSESANAQEELKVYVDKRNELMLADWNKKSAVFDVKKGDANFEKFEKIKQKFKFADKDTPLTPEQVDNNLSHYRTYDEIGYFGSDNTNAPALPKGKSNNGNPVNKLDEIFPT